MSHPYARTLRDQDQTEYFISKVLGFNFREYPKIISKIVNAEKGLIDYDVSAQTLGSTKYRDREYKDDSKRWDLRKQIIEELFDKVRIADDNKIKLGDGGALPLAAIQKGRQAFVMIGLPASGKSTIANTIADKFGAIILDPDYAKRKLPEYGDYPCGATLVHEESDSIISGFHQVENPYHIKSVYELALLQEYNMVIPKIGHSAKGIIGLAEVLQKADYQVHLILVSLGREEATKRAIERLHKSDRYVPLGLIFDGYGNNPLLNYYLLRTKFSTLFASFSAFSTTTNPPVCIDQSADNPCDIYEKNLKLLF